MDTMYGFMMGELNRGKEKMVFDWDKAARIIKESKCKYASAGLDGDWEWTGGTIYDRGQPVMDSYTYLSSTWATPLLDIDTSLTSIPCYKMQSETPGWDFDTKWPESALKILEES